MERRLDRSVIKDREHTGKFTKLVYTFADEHTWFDPPTQDIIRNNIDAFDADFMKLMGGALRQLINTYNFTHDSALAQSIQQERGSNFKIFSPSILRDYLALYGELKPLYAGSALLV